MTKRESLLTALLVCCSTLLFLTLNAALKNQPYMDEIFHVPQLRAYLHKLSSPRDLLTPTPWNDKITTFPGLYWFSLPYCFAVHRIAHFSCLTSLTSVRLFNFVLWLAMVLLPRCFMRPSHSSPLMLQVALFPLLYFNVFLYYTDLLSLLFVMLMLRFNSSLFALGAVLVRQSNIVWVFFAAALLVYKDYSTKHQSAASSFKEILYFSQYCLTHANSICLQYMNWILIGLGFVAFLIWNGGSLVLGDKSNHTLKVHVPQVCYWAVFMCAMLPGHVLLASRAFIGRMMRGPSRGIRVLLFVVGSIVLGALSYRFAYVHPFILSDNRHYIFYLWRVLFKVNELESEAYRWRNAYYAPIYVCCLMFVHYLVERRRAFWRLMFFLCVSINVIMSPLVEFRYFIIPYVIACENMSLGGNMRRERMANYINMLYYVVVNSVTLYIFIYRPFGVDQSSRFMW